jgi:ABC-2 type transport system ATP-binding protein
MTLVVEATGLRKRYGSVAALDGLDLAVEEGHVVGLLGPNGAGKTTALRILVGLVRADAGTVSIAGEHVGLGWVAGERVGAMVASPVHYPHLSGAENLRVLAAAWGWPRARADARIAAALDLVDLGAVGRRPAKGYSTGMRQRLGIALALLADAPILILDEPVNGLDPAGIVEIRDLLLELADGGRTILVSSHLLTEVEKTCDHVTIVDRGRIVASGTPGELAGGGERIELRLAESDVAAARRTLEAAGLRVSAPTDAGLLWVEGAPDGSSVARQLAAVSIYPDELIRRRDSLEEVFLRLTGVAAADPATEATP